MFYNIWSRGEQRAIQSEPIILEVTGAPQISRFAAPQEVVVQVPIL